jgi:hypothetical protein
MLNANQLIDRQYHEMRWRILSLAADIDRLDRSSASDARISKLREALSILISQTENRAEQVQLLLSDK